MSTTLRLHGKAAAAVAVSAITVLIAALAGDNTISPTEGVNIAIAGVGAIGVALVPYLPTARGIASAAKAVVAAGMAALMLAHNLIADGITVAEWLQLAVAAAGAVGVYRVPNQAEQTALWRRPPPV